MKLTATIKEVKYFNVVINGHDLGEFKVQSKWEGFVKVVNSKGLIIFYAGDDDLLGFFGGLFSDRSSDDVNIVSITPSLLPKEGDENDK